MPEKPEIILKYICMGLGALLFIQFIRIIVTANPLAHVVVPALPSLVDDSSATNQPTIVSFNNSIPSVHKSQVQDSTARTNVSILKTNIAVTTSVVAQAGSGTNAGVPSVPGTNAIAIHSSHPGHRHQRANQFPGGMSMGFMPTGKQTTVAPIIQASIDRITDSEILGPVVHPLPMALLGIAGDVAFLRSPDGQTGLVKEGDELGTIKLIKIGTNRVLVEANGQRQELTIFDGMGGDSLLDKSLQSTNENNNP